jgi:hypothetical protein
MHDTSSPPSFPPLCRSEGHAFSTITKSNPFGGRNRQVTYCTRCGIEQHAAGYWMARALEREVKGMTDDA